MGLKRSRNWSIAADTDSYPSVWLSPVDSSAGHTRQGALKVTPDRVGRGRSAYAIDPKT
jgi:hypothetical protein